MIRTLVVLALAALSARAADWALYVTMATTKDYVVGAKLLPSGLFRRNGPADWQRLGYNHPFQFSLDYDPADTSNIYVAAGNGLLRVPRVGTSWKILTGQDVTELRDVTIDSKGAIYFGHTAGLRVSTDRGTTWRELAGSLRSKYTEAACADRARAGAVIIGTADGLWRTDDAAQSWRRVGAAGFQVMRIAQSPHEGCYWLAGTQKGGLFASRDCGVTFENVGNIGVGSNVYDIAFDPTTKKRIAVAGWGFGILVSEDDGLQWKARHRPLPSTDIWSLAFDPSKPGRLFANVHEEGVFVSEDAGQTWSRDGLPGVIVTRMKFVQEGR